MNKRQDILPAAEKLFYIHGLHASSTDPLCAEARVSTRTFYCYFPSCEKLTLCVMQARQQRFFAELYPPHHPQAISHLFKDLKQWLLRVFWVSVQEKVTANASSSAKN